MIDERELAAKAAANPEPRCLLALILDDSGSMSTEGRIDALNAALPFIKRDLMDDPLARKRIEIAVYSVSSRKLLVDFTPVPEFEPPVLRPHGDTPLGAAVAATHKVLRDRMRAFAKQGVRTYRPWVIISSDGDSNDDITAAAAAISEADGNNELNVFAIGVGNMDLSKLAPFTHKNSPVRLDGVKFTEFFQWVTANVKSVSHSKSHSGGRPDEAVPLTSPKGWIAA